MESSNDEQRARMKKYIDAVMDVMLTAKQKQVVWMYHAEGKKTAEIAAALQLSPRRVQVLLATGMKKINKSKKIFLKSE